MTVVTKRQARLRRRRRVRARIVGSAERPRLSVYRSNKGVFAQLIDDGKGHTVAAVNWIEPELNKLTASEQAKKAGELLAERGKAAGVENCVFDRGGYQDHGRVKALAEGAREGGLGSNRYGERLVMKGMDMTNVETVSPRGLDLRSG